MRRYLLAEHLDKKGTPVSQAPAWRGLIPVSSSVPDGRGIGEQFMVLTRQPVTFLLIKF